MDRATGGVRVVDLETGQESSEALRTRDGSRFIPLKAYPEAVGVSAIDTTGLIARFEAGMMVESLRVEGDPGGGTRLGDVWSVIVRRPDGSSDVDVVDLTPGAYRLVQSVPTNGPAGTVHPRIDGGVVAAVPAEPLRLFDASGAVEGEFEVPGQLTNVVVMDATERWIAVGLVDGGLIVIDTATNSVDTLPGFEFIEWDRYVAGDEPLASACD